MPTITTKDDVDVDFGVITLSGTLHHDDAQRALWLLTDEGPEHIPVNLQAYGLAAAPGHVYIKDWSEHAGLAARLAEAGIVRIVDRVVVGPFASAAFEVEMTI